MGLGITATTSLSDQVNARALLAGFSLDTDGNTDDIEYDASADILFAGGMLDFHPAGGGFRLSAGLLYNGSEIDANGECNSASCEVGDTLNVIQNGDRVEGDIDFDSAAPYIGLGWGNAVDRAGRWSFSFDLGAAYIGEGDVSLRCTQVSGPPGSTAACNMAAEEEERELQEDVADFEWYPVLMIGAAYRF